MRPKGKVEDFLHTAGQAGAEGRFLTKPVLRCVFDAKTGSLYEAIQEINKNASLKKVKEARETGINEKTHCIIFHNA
jgi:hypothetical protein